MSLSQSLINQQHEYVNFAPSWQAGIAGNQGFPKFLKKYDIEAVNVIKTCEKLQLTLEDSVYFINESQGHDDSEKQCAVRISNMPFRAITNMWFGTLKIYQQQVNNLFRLSKDLLIRSSKNEFIHLETRKRKSTLNSNNLAKKPRLTCSNYNQLLNEMEKLTQATQQKSVDEFTKVVSTSRSVTQLQIREITIRDISATTFTTNDIAEEDSGFGEATHEEIVQFLNFMKDDTSNQNIINMNTKPQKRKSTLERDVLIKQCHYSHEEPMLDENVTSNKFSVSAFERCKSPNEDSFSKLKCENSIKTVVNENINHESTNDSAVNKIKQEYIDDYSFEKQNFKQAKTTKSKLIIDVCTKIDVNEMLHEMYKTKPLKKSSTRRLLKQYKIKRNATALELLTTFNRRFLKRSQILKRKICYSRQQFEKDYVNLLRDIFQVTYNHNLASVIYPKYLCAPKKRQQKKTPHLKNKISKESQAQQLEIVLNNSDDYLNAVVMPFNNKEFENQLPNEKGCDNYKANITTKANINNQKDWQPYGVMTKLLNLWRCNQTTEIDSDVLFKLAANRFEMALGFYSLLFLSKNHFVVLTTFPNTITIRTIVMGRAIKSVIDSKK